MKLKRAALSTLTSSLSPSHWSVLLPVSARRMPLRIGNPGGVGNSADTRRCQIMKIAHVVMKFSRFHSSDGSGIKYATLTY